MSKLHCWMDRHEHVTNLHGFGSQEWAESHLAGGATCMLPAGHLGVHRFTPDDKIGVSFAEEEVKS